MNNSEGTSSVPGSRYTVALTERVNKSYARNGLGTPGETTLPTGVMKPMVTMSQRKTGRV